jgi:competence protein ComEC
MAIAEGARAGSLQRRLKAVRHDFARLVSALEEKLEAERRALACWLVAAFGSGIAFYFAAPTEPPLALGLAWATIAAFAAWRMRRARLIVACLLLAVLACGLGFAVGEVRARLVAAPVLSRAFGPTLIEGTVRDIAQEESRTRITLGIHHIRGLTKERQPVRARVTFYGDPPPELAPGAKVRARVRLMPPPGPAAPDAYDFARTAWFQRIGAVGLAFGPPAVVSPKAQSGVWESMRLPVERLRSVIGERVRARLEGDVGAVATTLINGDRAVLGDDVTFAFRASGLQHILSISGLHFTMVAFGIFGALRLLFAAIEPLALRYNTKKWAAAAALVGGFLYLLISGAAIPATRAFLMLTIVLLAVLVDRRALTMRNVAIAAGVILLFNPEYLLSVSFQMSFAAVMALIAAFEARRLVQRDVIMQDFRPHRRVIRYAGALALSSVVAMAATAPFAAYHFHNFYGYGLPANMLALPVLGALVMPAATLSLVLMPLGMEGPALAVMGFGIDLILEVARGVSRWPGAVLLLRAMPSEALLLVALGGFWLCIWQTRWRRWGLAPIALGLAIAVAAKSPDLIVDDDAKSVASRGEDGSLVLLRGRASHYTGTVWLSRDADKRAQPALDTPRIKARPLNLQCDALGCTYRLRDGRLLALSDTTASLAEDCRQADIVIARVPLRRPCTTPTVVIDRFALWRFGAHEVWLSPSKIKIRHAQQARGARFWSPAKPWRGED